MDWVTLRSRGKELVRKYRYVLLVVLAGLFLMALPDGKNTKAAPEPAAAETEPRQDLQTGLEEILSQIRTSILSSSIWRKATAPSYSRMAFSKRSST